MMLATLQWDLDFVDIGTLYLAFVFGGICMYLTWDSFLEWRKHRTPERICPFSQHDSLIEAHIAIPQRSHKYHLG
jgi:hypothetical protein